MGKSDIFASASIEIADHIENSLYGGETFCAEIVLVLDADGYAKIDMRSVPANSWIENEAAASGCEIEWTARTRVLSVPRRRSSPSGCRDYPSP